MLENSGVDSEASTPAVVRTVATSLAITPISTVSFFANSAYVDATSEAANLAVGLSELGYAVRTFTGTSAADFARATASKDVLVFPEIEIRDLNAGLDTAAQGAIRSFVADGGIVLQAGDGLNNDVALANALFGFNLVDAGGVGETSLDAAAAAGTSFAGGSVSLPGSFAVSSVARESLPEGAVSFYGYSGASSVFTARYGAGAYVYLGFDWFETPAPAAWQDALARALEFAGNRQVGTEGADTLAGGGGRNDLHGLGGADQLAGGPRRDGIDGGAGDDTVICGEGDDVAVGGSGNDAIDGGGGRDEIAGGAGSDTLTGGRDRDVFVFAAAEAADGVVDVDHITDYDVRTNDVIALASGVEVISASVSGDDLVMTLTGGDQMLLKGVADRAEVIALVPSSGTDQVDSIVGTGGDDSVRGMQGADTLVGSGGRDFLQGDDGADLLDGGFGNDSLHGGAGADTLIGGTGDDVLDGGGDGDQLVGEAGDDTYFADTVSDVVIEAADGGRDIVFSSVVFTLRANVEDLTLSGTANINGTGNALNNEIAGNDGANELSGLLGADTIFGNGGTDSLRGGAGNDLLIGGQGGDSFFFGTEEATDGIIEQDIVADYNPDQGDTLALRPGVSVLASAVAGGNTVLNLTGGDEITLTGIGDPARIMVAIAGSRENDSLLGSAGADTILGSSGNDTLEAGGGGDLLSGGAGNDLLNGEAGDDRAMGDDGDDTLDGGDGADALTGGSGRDSVLGAAGNDTLDGGPDLDLLFGMEGDDTYVVNDKADVLLELSGQGTDTVLSSLSFRLGANIENLTLTGTGDLTGTGNALANALIGNKGANRLEGLSGTDTIRSGDGNDVASGGDDADLIEGGAGADSLDGGLGDDTLIGERGSDSLKGAAGRDLFLFRPDGGSGSDVIDDFEAGVDRLDLQAFNLADFDQLAKLIDPQGADILIDLRTIGGDAVLLKGINVFELATDNILI